MDIALFIAELLHQKDEVSIPHFGTFSRKRINAFYNPDTDLFVPPSEKTTFNSHTDDHEILAGYISSQKNISLDSAKYFISKFADEIKAMLESTNHADLKNLGTIQKENDELTFKANEELELAGNYFGLSAIKDLHAEPTENLRVAEAEEVALLMEDSAITEQEAAEEIRNQRGLKTSTRLMIVAAILIIIAALVYFFNPQVYDLLNQNSAAVDREKPIEPPKSAVQVPVINDSTNQVSNDSSKTIIPQSKPATNSVAIAKEPQVQNSALPTFEIIGAAFGKRTEAEAYVKVITSRGLYAKIVDQMPGSKVKVSLGSFTNEQEAQKELIRIKKNLTKDAWVARVKPKKTN
ncbi:MAG: SPOR domain-containing protein [Pyrinomonadaceae bacterium]|nr:SPOR domain-containing protein [Sphingobacteriaceae bacterium]